MTVSIRRGLPAAARTGLVLVVVAALVSGLAGPNSAPRASAEGSGLEVLGELDLGCPDGTPGGAGGLVLDIDPDARRLYTRATACSGNPIVVHDISTEIPTVVQVGPPTTSKIAQWKSNTTIVSPEVGRMFVLGYSNLPDPQSLIEVYDLKTLEHLETWTADEETPGVYWAGFAHDPDRDRIYILGELGHRATYEQLDIFQTRGNPPQAVIAAVDDTSGERIWLNPLDGCETPLNSQFQGGIIKINAARSMLYAFCVGAAQAGTASGQGGLLRLDVSGQDNAEPIVDFKSEFFPVSGDYTSGGGGVAGLDPVRERFFAQSLSNETHGAWVFDGDRSSWIGFVAAEDATNRFIGLDPATGKHYMGGGDAINGTGWINVTDGGTTPVPQGRLFEDIRSDSPWASEEEGSLSINSNMLVDPPTGRLFAQYRSRANVKGVLVLRDSTPPIDPRTPLELDDLTQDLPDGEARLEFSANGSGFGAQYVQVGGWENIYTRPGVPFANFPSPENPANIRYGNRGATMSLVERIGIAQSGASASAIATRPDDNTPADAETKQNEAKNDANEHTDGGVNDLSDAVDEALSDEDDSDDEEVREARHVTCLDGVGDDGEPVSDESPDESEEQPAYAKVVCDLDNLETTGKARFSGGSGGGGLIVSDSSFDGRTYRDPERGVVTVTKAIAEGIFFGAAGTGFSIDRVTSEATTWAKGLDGTAHVRWVRTVEGMRTFDADGNASEPESCTTIIESGEEKREKGRCESLQKDLNTLMPNRFEVKFPEPEVVATPGGAFASVQETETDFLSGQATNNDQRRMVPGMEMTVFADGPQRGRLWVQLAAVKADATFIRSPLPPPWELPDAPAGAEIGDPDGETDPTGSANGAQGDAVGAPSSGGTAAPPVTADEPDVAPGEDTPLTIAAHQERLVGGFGWLPALRSLGDAVLTGALYLVFLLPLAEIVRRRRLLDVLADGGTAGASSQAVSDPSPRVSGSPMGVSRSPVRSTP